MRVGDLTSIPQMIKEGTGFDEVLQSNYNQLGTYYSDRKQFTKAAHYYQLAKNYEGYSDALYRAEDYDSLENFLKIIPEVIYINL
jgi:hypothetical protein